MTLEAMKLRYSRPGSLCVAVIGALAVAGLADRAGGEWLDRVLPFLNEKLASPPIEWMPCPYDSSELAFDRFRVDPSRLRCGQILVPEDRSRADGRSLRLTFTIVKAEHPASGAAPVVYLEGGPGVAGLNAYVLGFEAPALATERDMITFDQRGTGRSEPLCPALDGREREVVRRDLRGEQAAALRHRARQECLDELRRLDVDPSAYDMAATVADVEDLRRALAIERWTLLGRSYGGALAQRIMRHHPQTVHSVVLINPLPLDWLSVAEWVPTFARTLRRIAEECAADHACRDAFGDPLDELVRAYDRTETEPWTVDVATSDFGAPTFTINGTDLIALIDALLYAAENTPHLPRIIRSLAERDSAVAAAVVGRVFGGGPFEFWPAVQYSVWCRDAVTADFRERLAAAVADHAPALHGVGFPVEVCDDWPVVTGPAHERLPVESDIPTLILSGGRDHVVPAALGTAMLSGLRNGRQVVFPFSAHVLPERSNVDCVLAIMHAFLANPRGVSDASCVGRIERRPFSTELPEWMADGGPSQQRQQPAPAAATGPADPRTELPQPFIEWTELPPDIEVPHQLRDSVRFGYLHVPQDHAHPTGPMMRMAFAIVPATAPDPAPDPVVFIVGGPGFAGIAPHFRNRLRGPHPLDVHRGRRDLIVFDQRGNGLSDPHRCPEVTGTASPQFDTDADSPEENVWLETLASCRGQLLAEGVRLETISSVQVAHDLEWLRRALGSPQLNLIGTSYGSRVAAEAARQIPAVIRAVNFSGPVPPGSGRLDGRPEQADEVLLTLFRRCAERPACRAAYPRLKTEYDSVLARLRQAPFTVRLSPSDLGPGGELLVDDAVMRAGLADLLVNRDLAAGVPLLIHTVFERGESFLVRMAPQLARQLLAGDQDPGTALAFWCNDGAVDRSSEELLRQRCRAWIGAEWDHGGAEPLRSDVPALIDTGELDPRTPPSDARALAAGLSRAHLVIVSWYGHQEPAPCALRIARDFIDAPERAPDTACLDSIPPIDFVTGVAYSSWIGAAVTRTWQRPWLAGLPGLAALLLLVSAVGIPLRDLRGHDLRRTPARRTASFALLLVALVGLTLILGLTAALTAAARQHLFIPAIGLPENLAWLLALPWVLLVLAPVAAVVALRSRGAGHSLGPAGWSALVGSGLILTTWLVNLLA